jgi:hypothetical protein
MKFFPFFPQKKIAWATALFLLTLPAWTLASQKEPDFSGTGRPGRQTSGESRSNCPATRVPLTASMPVTNMGKTIKERPTLWFYVPYSPQDAPIGEFVLQDDARRDLYRIPFRLPKSPGLVSVTLPKEKAPLTIARWYRWYFKLYCDREKSSSPIFVQGWIQRIALTPRLKQQLQNSSQKDRVYAERQIWYDAIDYLAKQRAIAPSQKELSDRWYDLLNAKGVNLKAIASQPILGDVVVSEVAKKQN